MSTAIATIRHGGVLRYSRWDALFLVLALGHGLLLLAWPILPVIAIGLWWNANTIAHNFIHKPFFWSRTLNRLFSVYLSLLLGLPQTLWRDRHLAHHAGVAWRGRTSPQMLLEVGVVLLWWAALLVWQPWFFLTVYMPGFLLGLGLCGLHGYYEHAHGTTSHYGRLYNLLFFNDGYHVEHHAFPGRHWTELPECRVHGAVGKPCTVQAEPGPGSAWPAVLRWLEIFSLEGLERLVLHSRWLQAFVVWKHEAAFRRLLPYLPAVRCIGVVGGGLFPRSVLVLRRVLPEAKLIVIDACGENLRRAQNYLGETADVQYIESWFDPAQHTGYDLLIVPLAYIGDRTTLYKRPPAPVVLIHDWIWRRRKHGVVVSWLLLKRINLVMP